ncbi:hypothetical protein LQZ21_05410 [Treponema sp. TIM-1]|uniref:hypothetical protein n=1 Tax=Treponema sp. TIM-1 TaxID=2898417 RepID=UPI00397EC92E
MKRMLFIFVGLAMISIHGFALGGSDSSASRKGEGGTQYVIETPNLDEVRIQVPLPRRNAGIQRAGSPVYALPADALAPEAERIPPPVYAISGVRGQEIREVKELREIGRNTYAVTWEVVDIVVELPEGETFSQGILEGEDVSDWIENLPDGLEATAHKVKKGANSIKIYISGIPTVTMRELIRVNIPGTYLTRGNSRAFVSPTEEASFQSWQEGQTAADNN